MIEDMAAQMIEDLEGIPWNYVPTAEDLEALDEVRDLIRDYIEYAKEKMS